MRILIVGAGATGGYFGGRLAQAGRDVTFLVRPARAQQLRRDGLQLITPQGDIHLTPRLTAATAMRGPFNLIVLGVKSFALEAALDDIDAAVGEDTMILPLLNGMHHVDTIARRYGKAALLGGTCKINATLDAQGRVVQMTPLHELTYGEWNGDTDTARIRAVDEALRGAVFDARLSPHIEQDMWDKWLMLSLLGALACLLRGSVGDIARAPYGEQTALRMLEEVRAIVEACGHAPPPRLLDAIRKLLGDRQSAQASSMYRDLIGGQRVEADVILGDLIARGHHHGVTCPLLTAAYVQLAIYSERLQSAQVAALAV